MSRGRIIALALVAVALVINVVIFFTYRVRQQERIKDLAETKKATEARLLLARQTREAKDRQLALYRSTIEKVAQMHEQEWATPQQRLVPLILEIRSLAQQSGLVPRAVNYRPATDTENEEITTIAISFGVQGTYAQARKLVHLVENSEQFVYIDAISLDGRDGEQLQLALSLKTLFRVADGIATEGRDS